MRAIRKDGSFFVPKGALAYPRDARNREGSATGAARRRGILSFSKESIPLKPPRERTRGLAPRPRLHWQSVARRAARPAESGAVYVASPRIPSFRHHSQPRPTPWGASDGSTAADCLRGRLCCARRGWDCCFSISTVFFSVNGPQLMEIRTGQLRDLA